MNENLFLQTQFSLPNSMAKWVGLLKWVNSCVWVSCHTFLVLLPHLPPPYCDPTITNFKCCVSALYS